MADHNLTEPEPVPDIEGRDIDDDSEPERVVLEIHTSTLGPNSRFARKES